MMRPEKEHDGLRALYYAAFFMEVSISAWFVAVPFIIKNMGGSDAAVGVYCGMQMALYMVGCVVGGGVIDRFHPKRVVQCGAGGVALVAVLMVVVVALGARGGMARPVRWFGVTVVAVGPVMALFWPALMGWLSRGYEGAELNRRLGRFNFAWSVGALASPYLAGKLTEIGNIWPVAGAAVTSALCFLCVSRAGVGGTRISVPARSGAATAPDSAAGSDTVPNLNGAGDVELLRRFRWMARVALLCVYVACGLMRTQLGIFMKLELGFRESNFGTLIFAMSLANVLVFLLAGRTDLWHYRAGGLLAALAAVAASMVLIPWSVRLGHLVGAAVVVGAASAFVYSSHIYYGVSGSMRRAARMALHELLLSGGLAAGAVVGGLLSEHYGRRSPYYFGCAVVVLAVILDICIWRARSGGRRRQERPNAGRA